VVVPVIRDERTLFLLVNSIEVRQFQQHLDEMALPAGWSLSLRDGKGDTMARRFRPEKGETPEIKDPQGNFVAASTVTPWSVELQVPFGLLREPILVAAVTLAAIILVVTLISVLGGRLAGRKLSRSVAALAGDPASQSLHPAITEIEAVRKLLAESASERETSEQALRDSLEEKVSLLKEVHHRVKNNLQIVASLLSLQARRSTNREALDVLQDTQNRVKSMALLHEALYRSGNLARINFGVYVKDLCGQLLLTYGSVANRVTLENRIGRIGLPLDYAVPCGLIVNELVSNALKHAFPDERAGKISVELNAADKQSLVLSVSDDGVGTASDLEPAASLTLGLQLVSRLATQLGGKLKMAPSESGGAAFSVYFPVPEGTIVEGES
jgi:two-component sensor histidine kinase